MFGGGGGLNPRKMQQMMEQMGIDVEELEADRVVISLSDGTDLVFDSADVTKMEARGQETYQVVGEPERQSGTEDTDEAAGTDEIPADDVELVVDQTGASADTARDALRAEDGDLAAAISRLS